MVEGWERKKAKSERKAVKYGKKIAKSRRKGYRNKLANSGRKGQNLFFLDSEQIKNHC